MKKQSDIDNIVEQLKGESFELHEVVDRLLHLQGCNVDMKKAFAISNMVAGKARDNLTSQEDYVQKEYISYELQFAAYTYILDCGATPEEALMYSTSLDLPNGVPEGIDPKEFIQEVKNRKSYHNKKVVQAADDHEEQKKMKENGTLCKKILKEASSANAQLRALHKQKTLSDTLEGLKEQSELQENKISNLEAKTSSTELDIKYLHEMQGLEGIPPKEKAAKLKADGHTQKVIAEALGISLPTVKRWWKSL